MDQRIKFRHLQTFIEVGRLGSIGKAAKALNITQPAVSHTIRDLEEILAVKLVEKEGRGIRVTEAGKVFLHHAGASLAAAKAAVDAVRLNMRPPRPPVRIGALPTALTGLMPEVVTSYLELDEGGQLKVVTGENRVLMEQLRLGQLDVVIGRLAAPEEMTGLSFEPLYTDTVIFAANPAHPLATIKAPDVKRLTDYPVLMPTRGSIIRPFVERFLIRNGIAELGQTIETVSDSFGRAYTMRSNAIWIISKSVIRNELEEGALALLDIDTSETLGSIGMTTRVGDEANPSLDAFTNVVRKASEGASG